MTAVDTNILVYAHRRDSEWHESAAKIVKDLAEGDFPWAIPWPCAHEFVAIVTHPRIYRPPSTVAQAVEQVQNWTESPVIRMIGEPEGYWSEFTKIVSAGRAVGGAVHDARIAAICCVHGVRELLSADRDFGRFPKLRTRNPLI